MNEVTGIVQSKDNVIGQITPTAFINVSIIGQGARGEKGDKGDGDLSYVYNQISASKVWTINHNLNKYPSVSIVDSAGNLVIGNIEYTTLNTVIILFTAEFSGKAYLN